MDILNYMTFCNSPFRDVRSLHSESASGLRRRVGLSDRQPQDGHRHGLESLHGPLRPHHLQDLQGHEQRQVPQDRPREGLQRYVNMSHVTNSVNLLFKFSDTPLYELYTNGTLLNSKHLATHMSDALRLAYIYKVCQNSNI